MCQRNSPDEKKEETSTGCVRETPQIKKRGQHGMCKRNSQQKSKASMGCVRETTDMKMKLARDV